MMIGNLQRHEYCLCFTLIEVKGWNQPTHMGCG